VSTIKKNINNVNLFVINNYGGVTTFANNYLIDYLVLV